MKSSLSKSVLHVFMLFSLLGMLFGALPATTAHAAENNARPVAQLLNPDGTLKIDSGYSGPVDVGDYDITLDPQRGPLFRPLATVNSWNSLSAAPINAGVRVITISGTDVYVGGDFINVVGIANADHIAKWSGGTWSALGTGLSDIVYSIAVSGTNVYAGGSFFDAGGDGNADFFAKWNGSSWSTLGTPMLSNAVYSIAISGTDVYLGGQFINALGNNANADFIIKWNGTSWSTLGATPLSNTVYAIAISGTDLYVGGNFVDAGGNANADYIAKWNGTAWSALGTGLNDKVSAVAISGTDVYAGGSFFHAGGNVNANYIAKWNGTAWSSLGTTPLSSSVVSIAISGVNVYASGNFVDAGGDPNADKIARWNGTTWSALGTVPITYLVSSVAVSGVNVFAGGGFTDAGGIGSADYIARFEYPATLVLNSIAAQDGWVLESTEVSGVGGTKDAAATTFRLGDDTAKRQYRTILSFGTAALPDNATILSAVLKIKQSGAPVGSNPFSVLGNLVADIRKGLFGAAAVELADFNATASANTVGAFNSTPVNGYYSLALNATGRAQINLVGNTQLRLRFAKDDNNNAVADYMNFVSGNNASGQPQLIISYSVP